MSGSQVKIAVPVNLSPGQGHLVAITAHSNPRMAQGCPEEGLRVQHSCSSTGVCGGCQVPWPGLACSSLRCREAPQWFVGFTSTKETHFASQRKEMLNVSNLGKLPVTARSRDLSRTPHFSRSCWSCLSPRVAADAVAAPGVTRGRLHHIHPLVQGPG